MWGADHHRVASYACQCFSVPSCSIISSPHRSRDGRAHGGSGGLSAVRSAINLPAISNPIDGPCGGQPPSWCVPARQTWDIGMAHLARAFTLSKIASFSPKQRPCEPSGPDVLDGRRSTQSQYRNGDGAVPGFSHYIVLGLCVALAWWFPCMLSRKGRNDTTPMGQWETLTLTLVAALHGAKDWPGKPFHGCRRATPTPVVRPADLLSGLKEG